MAQQQVQKVNWWHERFADWLLANPGADVKDAAILFNCHVQTLYLIKNSDCFKSYFAARSADVSGAVSAETINALTSLPEKVAALADMAIGELSDRIAKHGRDIPIENLTAVSNMALHRLGYGAPAAGAIPGQTTINNNVIVADAATVARARERMERGNAEAPQKLLEAPQPAPVAGSDTGA